jgi:hypothetical protein
MKKIIIEKQKLTKLPKEEQYDGIVGFQMVKMTYNFYGKEIQDMHDTKIMEDGKQFVVNGNGFIPQGFEIKETNDIGEIYV